MPLKVIPLLVSGALAAAMSLASGAPAAADTSGTVQQALTAADNLEMLLSDGRGQDVNVAVLLKDFADAVPGAPGLIDSVTQEPLEPEKVFSGSPESERLDVRLMLAMLQQQYGGKDNADVLRVFGDRVPEVLLIRSGQATPDMLRDLYRRAGFSGAVSGGTLRVPIVIWKDASLKISASDTVRLSRPDGAFILNFGQLIVEGGTIQGEGESTPLSPEFRPFVVSLESGKLRARGGLFKDLGFGNTEKFSGVSVLANPFRQGAIRDLIVDNTFSNVVGLSLAGAPASEVRGNRFEDPRGNALQLSQSPDSVIEGNVFFGAAPTNAIRIIGNSDRVAIVGNAILGGGRAGIVVQNGSDLPRIEGNLVWKRGGGGIKLRDARCGLISNNIILDNSQKGIEIRDSHQVEIAGNLVYGNRNSGIWISDQQRDSYTVVDSNALMGNGAGISGATAALIYSRGNDLTGQHPKIFAGDLATNSMRNYSALSGAEFQLFSSAGIRNYEGGQVIGCDARSVDLE